MASKIEPMTDAERRELEQLIEKRRQEIKEKRRLLDSLSSQRTSQNAMPISGATDAIRKSDTGLNDATSSAESTTGLIASVMKAASAAAEKAAAEYRSAHVAPSSSGELTSGLPHAPDVPEKNKSPCRLTSLMSGADMQAGGEEHVGNEIFIDWVRIVTSLAEQSGTVDVCISSKALDRFEKSCQCDLQPAPPSGAGSPVGAVLSGKEKLKGRLPSPVSPGSRVVTVTEANKWRTSENALAALTPGLVSMKSAADDDGNVVGTQAIPVEKGATEPAKPSVTVLPEEDTKVLLRNPAFQDFFDKASKTIERALGEAELFGDYAQLRDETARRQAAGELLRRMQTYEDRQWSSNRQILGIKTHPTAQDTFLAGYAPKENATASDPDGCALIWNVTMTQRAATVLCSQSKICSVMLNPYNPNLVLASSYVGAILIWDVRAQATCTENSGIRKRPSSSGIESFYTSGDALRVSDNTLLPWWLHQVYAMDIVGTEHAHNLVTVDTDGRLCLWSMAMMAQPTEAIELKKANKEISCLCMGFCSGENNSFLGGTDSGALFMAQIHGGKAGIVETYQGHLAPVTSIDWHPPSTSDTETDHSDLVLSTSFDWTINLWSPKTRSNPLHSFDAPTDYCVDAEWHPRHPGVFAAGLTDGALHLYDIGRDIELPQIIVNTGDDAVRKLKWANDGTRLMTGDTKGVITMWSVSTDISRPRQDDLARVDARIEDLRNMDQPGPGAQSYVP